jgi:hypothetical protein
MEFRAMDAISGQWSAIRVALVAAGAPDDNLDSGHDRPFRAISFPYRGVLAAPVHTRKSIALISTTRIQTSCLVRVHGRSKAHSVANCQTSGGAVAASELADRRAA